MPTFKIFYAWQSDRPSSGNRSFIREALDATKERLRADAEIEDRVEVDQDTQGVTGMPEIAATILAKIADCDLFVADLSFVGQSESTKNEQAAKSLPNPNVLVELGYAMGAIGTNRCLCVMNTKFGGPELLPFDLRGRRFPTCYEYPQQGRNRREVLDEFVTKLVKFIRDQLAEGIRPPPNKRVVNLAILAELSKRMNRMNTALEQLMDVRGVPTFDDIRSIGEISDAFRQFHDDNRVQFPTTFNEKLDSLWQLAKAVYQGRSDFIQRSHALTPTSIQAFHDAWGQFRITHQNLREAMSWLADDGGVWTARRYVLECLQSEMQINETNLDCMLASITKNEFQQMPILTAALDAALDSENVANSLGIANCTALWNVLTAARQKAEMGILSLLSASSAKGDVHRMRQMVGDALAKTP